MEALFDLQHVTGKRRGGFVMKKLDSSIKKVVTQIAFPTLFEQAKNKAKLYLIKNTIQKPKTKKKESFGCLVPQESIMCQPKISN